ncbi:MAG: sugar transferase [Methanolobus sp.]|nr:sugar transferase [Methanolobus sp.]
MLCFTKMLNSILLTTHLSSLLSKLMKQLLDTTLSFFSIVILSPLFIIVAILIKLTMPGPVIFSQVRIGKHGKPFWIFKFRSMKVNESEDSITLASDSRITPFGKFLRTSKIDELPQLWNILKGDMSFVGFRPDVPGYHDALTGDDRKLLTIKPGLSGADSLAYPDEEKILAQVEDPQKFYNEKLFPDKVRINREYVSSRSFLLDIRIILFTLLRRKLNDEKFKPRFV